MEGGKRGGGFTISRNEYNFHSQCVYICPRIKYIRANGCLDKQPEFSACKDGRAVRLAEVKFGTFWGMHRRRLSLALWFFFCFFLTRNFPHSVKTKTSAAATTTTMTTTTPGCGGGRFYQNYRHLKRERERERERERKDVSRGRP